MRQDGVMRALCLSAAAAAMVLAGACTSSTAGAGATTDRAATASAQSSASPSPRPAGSSRTSAGSSHTSSGTRTAAPVAVVGPARRALARMTLAQRVGQLLMVDCPSSGVSTSTVSAIRRSYAGSVILDGNSHLGVVATRAITDRLQALAPARVKLFVSTDQEGGLVQRMRGPGFTTIPSAVVQGTQSPAVVEQRTQRWAGELRRAGINVDLAPVLDTVPSGSGSNPPIGDLDREYGHTPARVTRIGLAVTRGLAAAGVQATGKHFPGLGRVSGNTDLSRNVTDRVTTRHDAYLRPFAAAVQQHLPFVMVSTAIYSRIDPGTPAIFSPTIVTGMLRHDLGFRGVIVTDDVGAAAQVSGYPPGRRAVRFVAAGGTMVLTVVPSTVAPMEAALLRAARSRPAFRAKVDAAALVVLRAKLAAGLLH